MSVRKCLVVDPIHESFFQMMEEIGWNCDYRPNITREEISREHQGYATLAVARPLAGMGINSDLATH